MINNNNIWKLGKNNLDRQGGGINPSCLPSLKAFDLTGQDLISSLQFILRPIPRSNAGATIALLIEKRQ
ncbi:MAG: hypothetical protein LBS55_01720 [Prevotellaceae bacterium]|jgi:hypothetical protein|nr:hypothetical protein [Prevotellaceae bacterium]